MIASVPTVRDRGAARASALARIVGVVCVAFVLAACGDDDAMTPRDGDGSTRDARGPDGAIDPSDAGPLVDAGPCARDVVPPALACPAATTLALGAASVPATAPVVSAQDVCDGPLAARAEPAVLLRGTTSVAYTASDRAGNTSTCTTNVTVLDAFSVAGLRVVHAELDAAGSTSVTIGWERSTGADVTGYRLERAPTDDGPWESVAVLTPGELLHGHALPPGAWRYRVVTRAGDLDGGASPSIAVHSIARADYNLRDRSVATVPFLTNLYGVTRHPSDVTRGPYPLVLILHGNHGNCRGLDPSEDDACVESTTHECPEGGYSTTPNAEGLVYLAETLAAQGVIAASISANALNCRDDFIFERSHLLLAHIAQWVTWAREGGEPFGSRFAGVVDLVRIGLVGHSRGGEAVAHVPSILSDVGSTDVGIASIFAIAPTDYHDPRPLGVPYAVLLPGCDGDVSDLSGMHVYDRSNDPSDPVVRSQVLFPRTNHNFFSREWRFDDNARGVLCDRRVELGAQVQQRSLETILGAWMQGTLLERTTVEAFIRADADLPESIAAWVGTPLDLRWSYASPERLIVTDFEEASAPDGNRLGPNVFTDFGTAIHCVRGDCGNAFAHDKSGVLLGWDMPMPHASFGLGAVNASGYATLSFRIVSRYSRRNTTLSEQDFVLRVRDADGSAAEIPLS
ncbi:MAG: HYR domain-containing protein, partial [Deltaproteobacteria bacterium]|nr:HYR domain-containing protein [Deltaproteobacteria bacterium]